MLVCVFFVHLHTRPRVQRAPGLPCALLTLKGGTILQNSGVSCRENAKTCSNAATSLRAANGSRECAPLNGPAASPISVTTDDSRTHHDRTPAQFLDAD